MATPYTYQAAGRPPLASRPSPAEAFLALLTHIHDRYDQQPRRPGAGKWRRNLGQDTPGTEQPITPQHLRDHLTGRATYAAHLTDQHGMARLVVVDDDHGGLAAAQAVVNHLARLGFIAWAIARRSLDADGQPRHNGSRLFMWLATPAHVDDLKPALAALVAPAGYATGEIMRRTELPFGRSRWTPAGDEYGQLVLAGHAPQKITSGEQGIWLLLERGGLVENDTARLLAHAPARPVPQPVTAEARRFAGAVISGGHADVVAAFNQTYTTRDVLSWRGLHPQGAINYRCDCSAHAHGDKTASIGISVDSKLAYFNAPHCHYHNQGRPYTAFSLWQTLEHGGDYRAAVAGARKLLSMPFTPIRLRQAEAPAQQLHPAAVAPLSRQAARVCVAQIAARAERDRSLSKSTRRVLREVCRLARATGLADPSWAALALTAGCAEPTARRAVATLVRRGYLAKHANATSAGQYAPNVLELLAQNQNDHYPRNENDQSIDSIKEGEIHCTGDSAAVIEPSAGASASPDNSLFFNSPAGGDQPAAGKTVPAASLTGDALRSAVWHVHATALLRVNTTTGEIGACRKSLVIKYVHSIDPAVPLADIAICHAAVMAEKRLLEHEQYCIDLQGMSDHGVKGELKNHKRSRSRAEAKKRGYWNLKIRAAEIELARRAPRPIESQNPTTTRGEAAPPAAPAAPPAPALTRAEEMAHYARAAECLNDDDLAGYAAIRAAWPGLDWRGHDARAARLRQSVAEVDVMYQPITSA